MHQQLPGGSPGVTPPSTGPVLATIWGLETSWGGYTGGTPVVSGAVTLHMFSVEHAGAPESVGVRAELVDSRYQLTPLPGGRTRVEVEIPTDPRGAMPVWIVNLIQRTWPRDTLVGIRNQLAKPWVRDHPLPD